VAHDRAIVITSAPIAVLNSRSIFQRAWPPTILMLALILTIAWAALLGYGLICATMLAL
jgi:hypothetical protein